MDLKDAEELCNTGPDEETVARERKRLRRVSFAEITSVHVFDRDEEYETPPDSKPSCETPESTQSNEVLGFQKDVANGDDSKENPQNEENGEEEEDEERLLFVRDMDFSSSPGSAVGSATSNDDDNFFGPVKASFIRSGRESNSPGSDDNHDITLDSKTFSMHYRSLIQSNSGGNCKTPMEANFSFEDKTPVENSKPISCGSSMVLTKIKKQIPHWSVSGGNSSGSSDSNDMSLIETNPHKYDYGRLSPTLNELLVKGSKDMDVFSAPEKMRVLKSSECSNGYSSFPALLPKDFEDEELRNIGFHNTSTEVVCYGNNEAMTALTTTPIDQRLYDCSVGGKDALLVDGSFGLHNQIINDSSQALDLSIAAEFSKGAVKASGNKLDLAGGKDDDPVTPLNNTFQMDLAAKHDGYAGKIGEKINEFPRSERFTPVIGQNINQQSVLLMEGSVSTLRSKRPSIFVDTAVSTRTDPFSRVQSSSISNRKNIRHSESIISIRNSIPKFNILGLSPIGVVVAVENEISNSALTNLPCNPTATLLDENSKAPELKQVDISATLPEESSSVAQKSQKRIKTGENEKIEVYPCRSTQMSEESVATKDNEECSHHLSSGKLSTDEHVKFIGAVTPPYPSSGLREGIQQHPLPSDDPDDRALVTTSTHSAMLDIKLALGQNEEVANTHDKFSHSSPFGGLVQLSSPLKQKGVPPSASDQRDQYFGITNLEQRKESVDTKANDLNMSYSIPMSTEPINLGLSLEENREYATMTFKDISEDGSINYGKSKGVDNGEFLHPIYQKESGSIENCMTPLMQRAAHHSPSAVTDLSFRTRTDLTKFSKKVPERDSSYKSASPHFCTGTAVATRLEKRLVERIAEAPQRKVNETHDSLKNDDMHHFVRKDHLSPRTAQNSNGHSVSGGHQCYPNLQGLVQNFEKPSQKRKVEEFKLIAKETIDEVSQMQKSAKVISDIQGTILELQLEHSPLTDKEVERTVGSASPGLWANVFTKFSGVMEGLLLPSSSFKLKTQELGNLEDMLNQLQKAKKYEKLCSFIQLQRTHDQLGDNLQHKRAAEAKCLQERLIYEKAKMELLHAKQKIIREKLDLLQVGIQMSQKQKSSLKHVMAHVARDAQKKEIQLPSFSAGSSSKNEEAYNKVTVKRHELGALDQELNSLNKSILAFCKIKGERHPSDTILLVNDYLWKKMHCRSIQKELQLWGVDSLESKIGHHSLVLNYYNFLIQRFTVNHGAVSKIISLNKFNDAKISKSFRCMNACTAFAFVFNADAARSLSTSKSLAVETQISSSLLGNLLDVVEEIQTARIELRNLILTSFHSPDIGLLELELSFISFKTGNKVLLTFDMTCLNRGIYPSEILPCASAMQTSQALSAEIEASVGVLRAGYSRILRLCRCVSQIIQASDRFV